MKHLKTLVILLGAIFLSPTHSRAEPYTLCSSLDQRNQAQTKGSRSPKRPLVVDLVGNTLIVPSQVIGYLLSLESEEGEVYTYYITGTNMELPQELSGSFNVAIYDDNVVYKGTIFF